MAYMPLCQHFYFTTPKEQSTIPPMRTVAKNFNIGMLYKQEFELSLLKILFNICTHVMH